MPPTPRPPRIWAPTTRNHPTGPPIRVALLVGSILAGCGDSLLPTSPEAPAEPEIVAFVAAMNEHRIEMGCDPLRWNPRAADVATAHSRDMVERGFFAHANPEGQGPADRLSAAGIDYRSVAENIAMGFPTGASVLQAWLGSSGHRANIERCALTEHGVGLEGTHWTHIFLTP